MKTPKWYRRLFYKARKVQDTIKGRDHMPIPEVRDLLSELAEDWGIPELHMIAGTMHRRPPVKKVGPSSQPASPELGKQIRSFADRHPQEPQSAIAAHFNVNIGRVSEALNGKL